MNPTDLSLPKSILSHFSLDLKHYFPSIDIFIAFSCSLKRLQIGLFHQIYVNPLEFQGVFACLGLDLIILLENLILQTFL